MIVNYNYLFDNDDYYVDFDYDNDYDADADAMLAPLGFHLWPLGGSRAQQGYMRFPRPLLNCESFLVLNIFHFIHFSLSLIFHSYQPS